MGWREGWKFSFKDCIFFCFPEFTIFLNFFASYHLKTANLERSQFTVNKHIFSSMLLSFIKRPPHLLLWPDFSHREFFKVTWGGATTEVGSLKTFHKRISQTLNCIGKSISNMRGFIFQIKNFDRKPFGKRLSPCGSRADLPPVVSQEGPHLHNSSSKVSRLILSQIS